MTLKDGNAEFQQRYCNVRNCFVTSQRQLLGYQKINRFDAIMVYVNNLEDDFHLKILPSRHSARDKFFIKS